MPGLHFSPGSLWYNADMRSKKQFRSCLIALLFLLLLGGGVLLGMGGLLVVADPLEKADAIVVLSGGESTRIQEAISLYNEKYAGTIILTETGAVLQGYSATYSSEQRLAFIDAGIPPTAIQITGVHAASTREEAKLVLTQVANTNIHTLIIVTDPYHTMRTRLIWNDVFSGSGVRLIVRPARESWYRSTNWWMSTDGWRNTMFEYAKLAGYLVSHKLD